MGNLPSGTVTFLFTDIEGSTKLAQTHADKWESLRERHHAILKSAIEANKGYVFQIIGDAFCTAFFTASDALRAAIQSQKDLFNEQWQEAPIKVRMGIHTGKAEVQEDGQYHGYLAMSRIQRLMSAGHGGQVLLSTVVQNLVRDELPEGVSLYDLGEKRLKDLIRPEHIYQLNMDGLPSEFPPIKTLEHYRHNIPTQLTSFVGREKAIEEVKQELTNHRLVTLTGSGGTGKSRLSLQVAADLLDSFPDGTWFIELAPLSDPDLIPQTIQNTMGLVEQKGISILQALQEYLQEKKVLLVLDNCEHLLEASANVAHGLLSHSSNLKILASSREALGVQGEVSWRVPSLSLPDTKHIPDPEELSQYESVQLFIERASLVNPHFEVNKANAPAIAQVCFRLGGIPLAIELAAARIKALSVEQINTRLDDRFRLLTGGARTALPRQQTLRALIDWSYNLLNEKEKILFRRLAVFAGGWSLEAVESVCSDEQIDTHEVLDLMSSLVDKSLLNTEEFQGEVRYHRLETIRQYAREKFFDSDEVEILRNKHLKYYVELAEQMEPSSRGHDQPHCFHRFEEEMDNFRASFEWAHGRDNESLLRVSTSLWRFLDLRGYQEEIEWLYTAIRLTEGLKTPARAYGLARAAWVWMNNNELTNQLESWVAEGIQLSREFNCKHELAMMLNKQAVLDYMRDSSGHRSFLASAQPVIEFCKGNNNHWVLGVTYMPLGGTLTVHDPSAARQYFEEGVKHLEIAGDRRLLSFAYDNLVTVALQDGNASEALIFSEKAIEYAREIGDIGHIAAGKQNIGSIALFQDNHDLAEKFARESYKYALDSNSKKNIFFSLDLLAKVEWARGNSLAFLNYAEQALTLAGKLEINNIRVNASYLLGTAFHLTGELSKARQKFKEALDLSLQDQFSGSYRESFFCVLFIQIGGVLIQEELAEQSVRLLGAADAIKRSTFMYFYPYETREIKAFIAASQTTLGEAAFNQAWEAGQAMTTEQAIEYALEMLSK